MFAAIVIDWQALVQMANMFQARTYNQCWLTLFIMNHELSNYIETLHPQVFTVAAWNSAPGGWMVAAVHIRHFDTISVPEFYDCATPPKQKVLASTTSQSKKQIQSKICAMSVAAALLAVVRLNVLVAALTSAYNIRLFAVKNFGRP